MARVVLETRRLVLRRIDTADVDALLAVYGDADAMRWVDDGEPITRPECERWVEVTANNYATRGYGMFAVELRPAGPLIGFCGLVHPGGQEVAEVKYALARAHWGRGYATEAVTAILRYGAEEHRLGEVIATVAPENGASQRVLAKAGMRSSEPRQDADGSWTWVYRWEAPPSSP